jgi:hypothetical protein
MAIHSCVSILRSSVVHTVGFLVCAATARRPRGASPKPGAIKSKREEAVTTSVGSSDCVLPSVVFLPFRCRASRSRRAGRANGCGSPHRAPATPTSIRSDSRPSRVCRAAAPTTRMERLRNTAANPIRDKTARMHGGRRRSFVVLGASLCRTLAGRRDQRCMRSAPRLTHVRWPPSEAEGRSRWRFDSPRLGLCARFRPTRRNRANVPRVPACFPGRFGRRRSNVQQPLSLALGGS